MRLRRHIPLLFILPLALIFLTAQAVTGAEPEQVSYQFLSELAGMEPLSDFPPPCSGRKASPVGTRLLTSSIASTNVWPRSPSQAA